MRISLFVTALLGLCAIVQCSPRGVSDGSIDDKYLDLIRVIEEELEEKERENDPPYIESNHDDFERGQDQIHQAKEAQKKMNDPPYIDSNQDDFERGKDQIHQAKEVQKKMNDPSYTKTEKSYIEVAREVADTYMNDRTSNDHEFESAGIGSSAEALRSFNRPSSRIRKLIEQQARQEAEEEALFLLAAAGDESDLLREIDVTLTARSAKADPSCDIEINCKSNANRTFVDGKEFRNIDGICNNQNNYKWGMTYVQHRRLLPDTYNNGKWHLRINSVKSTRQNPVRLPSARNISNVIHKGSSKHKPDNDKDISLALFYFMQFIDHDLAKTPEGHTTRKCCDENVDKPRGFCLPIKAEIEEDFYKKGFYSKFQNQINEITSYLDASMVYGSTLEEEKTLRSGVGGWLEEGTRRFLPKSFHPSELPCNMSDPDYKYCFDAGDKRANVHPALADYHTIFVREHNRIATIFAEIRPGWSDERIYQETRKIIGALIQHFVYSEMLPVLFNKEKLEEYGVSKSYDYDESIDASMTQAFSMAYRYHQMMPHQFHLAREVPGNQQNPVENFKVVNQELAIQRPNYLVANNFKGIDETTLGLLASKCPHIDRVMNDATRNLLFLDNEGKSFDLAALNIMRAREWGMPTYTSYRAYCGLGKATEWKDLLNTTNQEDIDKLASVYPDVQDVDLWTGLMTERLLTGSVSGATQTCLLALHFANIKHGDRFWFENRLYGLTEDQQEQIKSKTIARIMCDNLGVTKMRPNVFRTNSEWVNCDAIRRQTGGEWDFSSWTA